MVINFLLNNFFFRKLLHFLQVALLLLLVWLDGLSIIGWSLCHLTFTLRTGVVCVYAITCRMVCGTSCLNRCWCIVNWTIWINFVEENVFHALVGNISAILIRNQCYKYAKLLYAFQTRHLTHPLERVSVITVIKHINRIALDCRVYFLMERNIYITHLWICPGYWRPYFQYLD